MFPTFQTKCSKCKCDLHINFNPIDYFALCTNCTSTSKLYSKTFCIKHLLLSDDDLKFLKCLHNDNDTCRSKYYLDDDIENIIKNKFDEIKKSMERRKNKRMKSEKMASIRKENLIQRLSEFKLNYKNFGDCYTYVKYGYPNIETVIQNEISRSIELSKRKKILYKELQKYNLPYDETANLTCYNFVNGISNKSLNDTIDDVKVDNFLINHTNYSELLKKYPDEIAREKALTNYMIKTDESSRHEVANNLIDKIFVLNIDYL